MYKSTLIRKPVMDKDLGNIENSEIFNFFSSKNNPDELFKKYNFQWDHVDVIISGKSSIDLSRLTIHNYEDAENFLIIYGYDITKENIKKELLNVFYEALNFIEEILIPDPFTKEVNLKVPEEIRNETDIRNILLYASDHANSKFQLWSCAILRVMHTISHINNDISLKFFPEIQRQILNRFWSSIFVNSEGEKFFGNDEEGIKIYDIDVKVRKERNSTILKLLHKTENVAADVFDQIGIRVITYDKVDALLIIRYLRKNDILAFCNVKPSRSMNRLMDLKIFKKILNHHMDRLKNGEIDQDEFERIIRQESERDALIHEESEILNPYTSKDYKSIQFTCRQMIRMKFPSSPDLDSVAESFSFFFPYEMQVVDIKTHLENRFGKGSHEKYKEKQLISARRRVLGKLVREHLKEITSDEIQEYQQEK